MSLSDKELALIQAARREAATRKAGRPPTAPQPGPTTPLDSGTVMGWDHPAANQQGGKVTVAAERNFDRVAALMEQERNAARTKRDRARRNVMYGLLGLAVLTLAWILKVLTR